MTFTVNLFTAPGDVVTARQSTLRDSDYGVIIWIGDATVHLKPAQAEKLHEHLGKVLETLATGASK